MKIEIFYCVNERNIQRFHPTDEADALQTIVPLIGKYYREREAGNEPYIEITEVKE